MNHRVEEEEHEDETEDYAALREQGVVADGVLVPEHLHVHVDLPPVNRFAVVILQEGEGREEDEDHAGREHPHEVHEPELFFERVADDEVGRVADHRRRAADVAEESHWDEHRPRVHVNRLAQRYDHRAHQKHGGHVVQESAQDAIEEHEQQREPPHVPFAKLDQPHAAKLEDAAPGQKRDDHHHAPQQRQRAVVHPAHDRVHARQPVLQREDEQHARRAHERDQRAVNNLGDDQSENGDEKRERDPVLHRADRAERDRLDGHGDRGWTVAAGPDVYVRAVLVRLDVEVEVIVDVRASRAAAAAHAEHFPSPRRDAHVVELELVPQERRPVLHQLDLRVVVRVVGVYGVGGRHLVLADAGAHRDFVESVGFVRQRQVHGFGAEGEGPGGRHEPCVWGVLVDDVGYTAEDEEGDSDDGRAHDVLLEREGIASPVPVVVVPFAAAHG